MTVQEVGEYDPKALEEKILAFWEADGVMEETLKDRGGERFSFLEGPPTANAPPALHHVELRTFKDVVNRFWYMQGKSVPRKAGWDCHGLPVEVQVEKELELEDKNDVLEYGLDKFIEKCRHSVFTHIKEWDNLTKRMAYWVDLKDPYVTMDNDYIESVWWSLKQLWEKDLLYEGYKVVPFCSRCGTPLSSHEVAQGYQTVKEQTVIVSFPAKGRDYSFLAWTTTPWTLLSNLALAVNPGVTYAVILYRGEKYLLAKDLAETRFEEAEVLEEVKGSELVGIEYTPLFNHFVGKLDKPAWRIIAGDFVTTEDGTGIVHIAPAFGEDDYNVGVENDLPLVNPIGTDGKFTSDVPELEGMFAKDADPKIIQILDERGSLVTQYPYEHEYPFCWRCKTPLLYYSMKSWFIRVSDNVEKLLEKNSEIDWYPKTIGTGRFGNWLENARDWGLSRNRFWGTPLPIWECGCGAKKAVGSRAELRQSAVGEVPDDIDLHRPYVDEVKLKCECGKQMERVDYVIDCWYDSGAAPFAQYHYPFENRDLFDKSFPYDYISEATDQTRGWFYTLLAESSLLFDKPAYKSCVVGGLLLDDNGEKMSKSNKNVIDPWTLFDSVGADAVRLQMCATAPWNAKRFGTEAMKETVIPVLRTLWNCYSFTVRYLLLDGFDPKGQEIDEADLEVEDRWIISRTNRVLEEVRQSYMSHDYHHVLSKLSNLIVEDLSRWYIKLIRDRLWLEDEEGVMNPSKKAAYLSLCDVFGKICVMAAPMAPFITEEIYQNLLRADAKSVHHLMWPKNLGSDGGLDMSMDAVRAIFETGSSLRQNARIKLRYPISKVTVSGDGRVKEAVERLSGVIKKQLNCKDVVYEEGLSDVSYAATPDFRVLGPKYGKDAKKAADAIRDNPLKAKNVYDSGETAAIGGFEIEKEMISDVKFDVSEGRAAGAFSGSQISGVLVIDTVRDQSLLNEALARDVIRHVQELRKKLDLDELQKIDVTLSETQSLSDMLSEFEDLVASEVRAASISLEKGFVAEDCFKYEGETVCFALTAK